MMRQDSTVSTSEHTMATLVVGPSWVGDMVMAQSLFQTLKTKHPNCQIDVIAPQWSVPILARMPEVRNAIPLAIGHGQLQLKTRYNLGKSLKGLYRQAIVLPRSLKAALTPFFAGIPLRTGYRGEMRYGLLNDIREFDKQHLNQTVKRFVALGLSQADAREDFALPQPQLRVDVQQQEQLLSSLGLDTEQPAVALFPGAEYGPAKQWPLSYYAGLAQRLARQGFQVWVMGSQKDHVAAEQIVAESGHNVINLCGKTSLAAAIDLIAWCQAAVSNDSGLMHVAAAVDCPTLAIYGSSSPDFTPPLSERSRVLYLNLDCSPCFQRQCPLGHLDCLRKISVEQVFDEVNVLLSAH